MLSESGKVVSRRFTGRIVESGLLVIAVALGVGAASSGFSLLANTMKAGADMLASPAYREIDVSARSSAEEMAAPAIKKPAASDVALTSSDLDAAQMAPSVVYSYVQNSDEIRFINAQSVAQENAMMASFAAMGGPGAGPGGGGPGEAPPEESGASAAAQGPGAVPGAAGAQAQQRGPQRMTEDELAKAQAQADLVIVEFEELKGYRVTPQYFDAWSLKAAAGSLFAESDADSGSNPIVLGANAAERIAGAKMKSSDLIGKKLLSREGNLQVVGVLAASGTASVDDAFFQPYKTYAGLGGAGGPPRRWAFNTQLRFAVSDVSKLDETETLLTDWFSSRLGEGQVAISNPRSEAQKLILRNSGISLLILILALSGFFIALVNVSQILMSRGLRMRKGVGIMMALGASRRSVMGLFASEATFVAVAGSLLGGLFAIPLSRTMQSALGLTEGSWLYVVAGVLISWALTMACSIVPAWQNSRIVPAEAMRAA